MRFCHSRTRSLCLSLLYLRSLIRGHSAIYVEEILRGPMAPRKGSSPFSRVKSPQLLDPRKTWYVLSNRVCGERPPKYFSRSKLPARFPEDIIRIKRSALQTVDGGPFLRESVFRRWNRRFIVWVNRDIPAPYTGFAFIPRGHIWTSKMLFKQPWP